jgi:hypothetical protein
MDFLPTELQSKIASLLGPIDLKALRLVSKKCAAIARYPLFDVLRFSGCKQNEFPRFDLGPVPESVLRDGGPGRTRTVEFARIPDAVDEVMKHSLAQCAKTFVFDPAYYRESMFTTIPLHTQLVDASMLNSKGRLLARLSRTYRE